MLQIKYFAYGSNLCINRLRDRVETTSAPLTTGTPYTLLNYKLVFNAGIQSFANIEYRVGERVEGVLYDLTPGQLKELDRYEALYEKHFFYVDKNSIGCVYICSRFNQEKEDKPFLDYLNIIIDGCLAYNLTETYDYLLEYKLKNYKIKKSRHTKTTKHEETKSNKNVQRGIVDWKLPLSYFR